MQHTELHPFTDIAVAALTPAQSEMVMSVGIWGRYGKQLSPHQNRCLLTQHSVTALKVLSQHPATVYTRGLQIRMLDAENDKELQDPTHTDDQGPRSPVCE